MYCPACRDGICVNCPDRIMLILRKPTMCTCTRPGHDDAVSGEPRSQQVQDPFTNNIHAPGAVISSETGEVKFSGKH